MSAGSSASSAVGNQPAEAGDSEAECTRQKDEPRVKIFTALPCASVSSSQVCAVYPRRTVASIAGASLLRLLRACGSAQAPPEKAMALECRNAPKWKMEN